MYIDPDAKVEDNRSTAWSFTLVSIVGLVLLILLDLDVLPVNVADFQKIILSIVMGILFLIFLWIGLHSFLSLKQLKVSAQKETALDKEITEWFLKEYTEYMNGYSADAAGNTAAFEESEDAADIAAAFEESVDAADIAAAFEESEDAADIGNFADATESGEPEALYYPRYQEMSRLILAGYPDISEEFKDHIIEELYAVLFPD